MKAGEAGVLAAAALLVAGGLFVGFTPMPQGELLERQDAAEENLSVYDQLKEAIRPCHFGNFPRETFRGDTTVWVADLDYNMYTVPQVDLLVTRKLRELEFTGITAREGEDGGIVFRALFPDGQPLEMQFIP